ncbi:hypothetical protein HQQ81_21075 [Microbacteriaceae bacterium VKM Ac-2854]|nr:hypothetical protein [Microbacteriaceae bacterium VKM Ac-2854]
MARTRARHGDEFLAAALPLAQIYLPEVAIDHLTAASARSIADQLHQARPITPADDFLYPTRQLWEAVASSPQDRETVLGSARKAAELGERVETIFQTKPIGVIVDDKWDGQVRQALQQTETYRDQLARMSLSAVIGMAERREIAQQMSLTDAARPEEFMALRQERAGDLALLADITNDRLHVKTQSFDQMWGAGLGDVIRIASKWEGLDIEITQVADQVNQAINTAARPEVFPAFDDAYQDARDRLQSWTYDNERPEYFASVLSGMNSAMDGFMAAPRPVDAERIAVEARLTHESINLAGVREKFDQVHLGAPVPPDLDPAELTTAIGTQRAARDARDQFVELGAERERRQQLAASLVERYAPVLGAATPEISAAIDRADVRALNSFTPGAGEPNWAAIGPEKVFEISVRSNLTHILKGGLDPALTLAAVERLDEYGSGLQPSFAPEPFTLPTVRAERALSASAETVDVGAARTAIRESQVQPGRSWRDTARPGLVDDHEEHALTAPAAQLEADKPRGLRL